MPAAEHVGASPSSCSFHLRQLARYGFVEEAGGGRGRARPWRTTGLGMRFSSVREDPATEIAPRGLEELISERQHERHRRWRETEGSCALPRARAGSPSATGWSTTRGGARARLSDRASGARRRDGLSVCTAG